LWFAALAARLAELRTPAATAAPAAPAQARVFPGQAPSPRPAQKGVDSAEEIAAIAARQRVASLAFDPTSAAAAYDPMSHRR